VDSAGKLGKVVGRTGVERPFFNDDATVLTVPRSWSDLTPAWMTSALASQFPGATVSSVRVGSTVDGTNRRARVHLTYRSRQGPDSVFMKREGRVFNRLALLALGSLESEALLFDSGVRLPVEHPKPLASAIERRRLAAVVIMEDVDLRLAHSNDATTALSLDEVGSGLRGLAALHGAFWDRPLPEPLDFLRPWRLRPVWAPVSFASLAWAARRLRSLGHGDLLPPRTDIGTLERQFRSWATVAATGARTVLHGDPHPGNTYTLPDNVVGFFDWQLVRTGNWSHDVGYFIVSALEVADRRDHERALLSDYLTELDRQGGRAPDFAEAWRLYRQTPTYGLPAWLHALAGGGFQPFDVCLATIERFGVAHHDLLSSQ
jgi:hypothetical protein